MNKYYNSTIQKGSQGDEVKKWQQFLNTQGYNLTVDGDFGDNTYAATTDYQTKNGLTVDGIVGKNTWGKAGYTPYSTLTTPTDKATTDTTSWTDTPEGKAALDDYNTAKEAVNGYEAPTYDDYVVGDDVTAAKDAIEKHNANRPGEYQSEWKSAIDALMNSIMNREKFSYNMDEDALYQQAVDRYKQMGKTAMADAMGQAAAMTGGYGNSYAASVGNQAYQSYLQEAHDMLPEYYQMALDRYNQEGQDLYNQYGLLVDRENTDYGRYRDAVTDWLTERGYLTDVYNTESDRDYSRYVDDRNFKHTLDQDTYERLLDYLGITSDDYYKGGDVYRAEQGIKNDDAWENAKWDESIRQSEIGDYQWQQGFDATHGSSSNTSGSDSGGNKGTTPDGVEYDNGSVSTEDIKAMQEAIGVGADGYWGPNSTKAAGDLTADEAYEAWKNGELGTTKPSTEIPDSIKEKASKFENNEDLADWAYGLADSGIITEDQADQLISEYMDINEKYVEKEDGSRGISYSQMAESTKGWDVVGNGGANFVGIDNDAKVKAPNGETIRLDQLVDKLVAEGMSKKEAKNVVKKLQQNLGISSNWFFGL